MIKSIFDFLHAISIIDYLDVKTQKNAFKHCLTSYVYSRYIHFLSRSQNFSPPPCIEHHFSPVLIFGGMFFFHHIFPQSSHFHMSPQGGWGLKWKIYIPAPAANCPFVEVYMVSCLIAFLCGLSCCFPSGTLKVVVTIFAKFLDFSQDLKKRKITRNDKVLNNKIN